MQEAPSDITFKLYDWNKLLKNKKLGEAVLSFKAITAAGSYHKLDLGAGNGTLLVFAKLFTGKVSYHNFPRPGPPTRLLFDPIMGQTARPGEVMRIGYLMRVSKPVKLNCIVFDILQRYYAYHHYILGSASNSATLRTWSNHVVTSTKGTVYASTKESAASHPLNNGKHKPYGESDNILPKVLAAGIHYFHIEFTFPSQDACGRFIIGGTESEISSLLSIGVDVQDDDDTLGREGSFYKRETTPIFLKSNFPFHLKPSLPPIYNLTEPTADAEWMSQVKVTWKTPEEGRNRTSPLPAHLYNPEVISDEDRLQWYLPENDILDAHGQERIYANLTWYLDTHHVDRRVSTHYLTLSEFTVDDTLAQPFLLEKNIQVDFIVRLVCDRFTISGSDPKQSAHNQFIYTLKPTNRNVGQGKKEYEVLKTETHPSMILSLPEEAYGHLNTSYVSIEVVAARKFNHREAWVIERRPIFVEAMPNFSDHSTSFKPVEPSDTGSVKVGYAHYQFLDRPLDSVADFGDPTSTFGPDRLVRLMVPATGTDGGLIDDMDLLVRNGSLIHSDALAKPEEVASLEFQSIGVPAYRQDKSMDEPQASVPLKVKSLHTRY